MEGVGMNVMVYLPRNVYKWAQESGKVNTAARFRLLSRYAAWSSSNAGGAENHSLPTTEFRVIKPPINN